MSSAPLRNGVSVPKAERGDGVLMVNMGELFAHARVGATLAERVPLSDSQQERFLLDEGDLLFARRSLTLEGAGQCSIVVASKEPRTWESSIIRVRPNQNLVNPVYLFYFFQSPRGRALIETIVEQVAVAGIRSSDLGNLCVPVPTSAEQDAIAEVLGALDDKIEANRCTQETAEGMARTLVAKAQEQSDWTVPIGSIVDRVSDIVQPDDIPCEAIYIGLEHMPQGSVLLKRHGRPTGLASAKRNSGPGTCSLENCDPISRRLSPRPAKVSVQLTSSS